MTVPRTLAIVGLSLVIAGAAGTALDQDMAPAPFIPVAFGSGGATAVGFLIEPVSTR